MFRKAESARADARGHDARRRRNHRLWRVQDAEVIGKLRNYFTPKKLHLLEGHERYEAMLAYRDELGEQARARDVLVGELRARAASCRSTTRRLIAAARHRVLRGLTVKRDDVLAAAKQHFIVEKLAGAAGDLGKVGAALADTVAHQPAFVVVFAGEADACKLTLSPDVSPIAEGVAVDRALQKLDPVVVDHLFIERHLPGAQIATEIDAKLALAALGTGANVTLILRPLSVEQIAHVDELGQLLPAHSTAFYPPLAPGLVGLVIDPDEDLV